MEIIDLTCKGCGKTVKPEPREGVTVERMGNGNIVMMQNDEPYTYTCPYCGRGFSVWPPAPVSGRGGISIKGNVSGSVIMSGNGNTVTVRHG